METSSSGGVNPAVVKRLLQKLAQMVPQALLSLDKQIFIGREILNRLAESDRLLLKEFVDSCLVDMRRREASDIEIGGWGSNGLIWLRVHGLKKPVPSYGSFETLEFDILIQNLLTAAQRELLYKDSNLDFSYHYRSDNGAVFRNRADCYFDLGALALNMRAIQTSIRDYDGFEFHPVVTSILSLAHTKEGLVLVTGITGSGKSSTLDSVIDMNNRTVDGHIIVIASPVEFIHRSQRCIVRHREVGRDTLTFKSGTVEALRQDPDIIVIGEMRDPDTILAALEVADSGHKVFSTLHTSSATESIERVIGEMPPITQDRVRNRLADILRCVISQKLVTGVDGKRVLAKEIMVMAPSIRAAIKNNNLSEIYQMINEGAKSGMVTMEQDLISLVRRRLITQDTALNFANNKRMMQQLLQRF